MSSEEGFTTPTRGYLDFPAVTPETAAIGDLEAEYSAPPLVRIQQSPPKERGDNSEDIVAAEDKEIAITTEEEAAVVLMMFSPQATTDLPALRTETWPYEGQKPNPISIGKARKFLVAAYATIPSDIHKVGIHGHVWIIETDAQWAKQTDTSPVPVPTKPLKDTTYDIGKQLEYADKMETYRLYHHLI